MNRRVGPSPPVRRFDRLWAQGETWNELDRYKIPLVQDVVRDLRALVRTVLDVGCGDGRLLRALGAGLGKVGLDRSEVGLRRAGFPSVLAASPELPFLGAAFDMVLCCDLLEHLGDPDHDRTLAEIQRVSRHYILITVPYREERAASNARCPSCRLVYNVDTHVRRYGRRAYRRLKRSFNSWELVREIPHGPVHRHYWSGITWGHQTLFGRYMHAESAVCPRCGSGTGPAPGRSRNPLYRAYCRITNTMGEYWPFTHHHERLLLLRRVA